MKTKTGILLINLGTPEAPNTREVRAYLKEFLMDELVIDIHFIPRWLLVNGFILNTRPKKSAHAYRQIWTDQGSPLAVHSARLAERLQTRLGQDFQVEYSMRYGKPSIAEVVGRMKQAGVGRIVAVPLYPQYSLAATESSMRELKRVLALEDIAHDRVTPLHTFYAHPGFVGSFAEIGREYLADKGCDHHLFSFHGIPERHAHKAHASESPCRFDADCCRAMDAANSKCYRAQCFHSAAAIARQMGLRPEQFDVSFQSRMGRTPWIQPFTDHLIAELPIRGVRRLAVFCPAFVADCLETLEEIQIRARDQFRAAGGQELFLVPSLNAHDAWVGALAGMIRDVHPAP